LNKTVCKTNEPPTRVILWNGSAVRLRNGTSRRVGRGLALSAYRKVNSVESLLSLSYWGKEMCCVNSRVFRELIWCSSWVR